MTRAVLVFLLLAACSTSEDLPADAALPVDADASTPEGDQGDQADAGPVHAPSCELAGCSTAVEFQAPLTGELDTWRGARVTSCRNELCFTCTLEELDPDLDVAERRLGCGLLERRDPHEPGWPLYVLAHVHRERGVQVEWDFGTGEDAGLVVGDAFQASFEGADGTTLFAETQQATEVVPRYVNGEECGVTCLGLTLESVPTE
jgi:hypothetical protein